MTIGLGEALQLPFIELEEKGIIHKQDVYSVTADTPVGECLQGLQDKQLRSCIIDNGLSMDLYERFDMFDMKDVVGYFTSEYDSFFSTRTNQPGRQTLYELLTFVSEQSVGEVAKIGRATRKFGFCDVNDDTVSVLRAFKLDPRVLICDKITKKLHRVFSVTDFVELLKAVQFPTLNPSGTPENLRKVLSQQCFDLPKPMGVGTVVMAEEHETTLDVMRRLSTIGVSALPIVASGADQDRHILGVVSVRDFRGMLLQPDAVLASGDHPLYVGIMSYISHLRQLEELKAKFPVIQERSTASVGQVMAKAAATHIHRVVLTCPTGQVVGLLSVTDIARYIADAVVVPGGVSLKSTPETSQVE